MKLFNNNTAALFTPVKQFVTYFGGNRALATVEQVNEVITNFNGELANAVQYNELVVSVNVNGGITPTFIVNAAGSSCNHFCGNSPSGTGCFNNCNEAACTGCYRTSTDGATDANSGIHSFARTSPGVYTIEFDAAVEFVTPNIVVTTGNPKDMGVIISVNKVSPAVFEIKTYNTLSGNTEDGLLTGVPLFVRFYKVWA